MTDTEAIAKIQKLYDVFNAFYYGGECVPEYPNLHLFFDLLEKDAPGDIDGRTDLKYSEKEDNAAITIKIKRELLQENNALHLSAVLLHEMVHAYLYVNHIYELNEEKTEAIHGPKFKEIALSHGLQDGYIIPEEEIICVMGSLKI